MDEISIGLLHLRHYPKNCLLAAAFQISLSTVESIIEDEKKRWYDRVGKAVNFQNFEWRKEHSIKIFQQMFTFATDGTEQQTKGSKFHDLEFYYFSAKKKQHSINVVVLVDLTTGKILWISPSEPGNVSDCEILKKYWHHIKPHLDESEFGLGDDGFSGMRPEIPIVSVPCKDTQPAHYKIHSSGRIIVENVFMQCKKWECVNQKMSKYR